MTQDKRMTFPNPMLVVVSGPSGVGKSTIVAELARRRPQVVPIVTATTRGQRPGEIDGVHYHFISDDELRERGEFKSGYGAYLLGLLDGWGRAL